MKEYKSTAILLLEGFRARIEDAPGTALNQDKAILDKKDTTQLLDKVIAVVEKELREYQQVTDKRAAILKEAEAEAKEVRYQAEKSASRIRVSKRRDGEPQAYRESELKEADKKSLRTAGDIYAASLIYTDEMLTEVDHLVNDSYRKIEQEYEKMQKTLKQKVDEVSKSKAELVANLDALTQQDRYGQILELADLLSQELYVEKQKEAARRREEQMQLSLDLGESKKTARKVREKINPDRKEVKVQPEGTKAEKLDIPVMDRRKEGKNNA